MAGALSPLQRRSKSYLLGTRAYLLVASNRHCVGRRLFSCQLFSRTDRHTDGRSAEGKLRLQRDISLRRFINPDTGVLTNVNIESVSVPIPQRRLAQRPNFINLASPIVSPV